MPLPAPLRPLARWPLLKVSDAVRGIRYLRAGVGMRWSANSRSFRALKDRHRGQRAFVIGNGPSLTIADLDRLQGEVTLASNKIYLAYDETAWRPSYYSCIDDVLSEHISDRIDSLDVPSFIPLHLIDQIPPGPGIHYFSSRKNLHFDGTPVEPFRFSEDAARYLYGGYSVSYTLLQIAFYLGIRDVYLIGMDHTWNLPKTRGAHDVHGEVLVNQAERNHFHPDYRPPGETWTSPQMEYIDRAFLAARHAFEKHGGQVWNATRGGALEIFERADLDSLF